ncbi:MAG: glycosyltransferase [Flavobacteriales bacterium]|nr:glycosyltransferase [Flavobacteriales bacterium]
MSDSKRKILFLYTELAGYILSCIDELVNTTSTEVILVRWPLNKEAPFDFKFPDGIKVLQRNEIKDDELLAMAKNFNPDLIFCSGWVDKGYLKVCKEFRFKIPVVVGLDNQWDGSFRQRIASLFRFKLIRPYFSHAWVPGERQKKFARRLGIPEKNISTGFYSADTRHFFKIYNELLPLRTSHFPKRFIYVGRYLPFKGIQDLWDAFVELQNEHPNEWELWCLGTGDLWDKKVEHPKIKHFGFVQPNEISGIIAQTGVFILPSQFEPWGVVVHEFAASGFPLICTPNVGASEVFLEENKNGFLIEAGNKNSIKEVLTKCMNLNQDSLLSMSVHSHLLSSKITPQVWTDKLLNIH